MLYCYVLISTMIITYHLSVKGELINESTVITVDGFDVQEDCRIIHKQLKKFMFPNLKTVMNILCHRTYAQRKIIEDFYNKKYCTKIHKDGTEESTCSLSHGIKVAPIDYIRSLNIKLFELPESMLAIPLYETIEGKKDHHNVEEIICAQDNPMKHLIQQYYKQTYGYPLEEHFPKYKSNDCAYQEAILKYCWPQRRQDPTATLEVIQKESKELQIINPLRDKDRFKTKLKELFGRYSDTDLKRIFQDYRLYSQGIDKSVDQAFLRDEKNAYNTLVRYIEDTCKYYADKLKETTGAWGDISDVNQLILTRSERDLACILRQYETNHHNTFTGDLKKSANFMTQNNYMTALRYLCGNKEG